MIENLYEKITVEMAQRVMMPDKYCQYCLMELSVDYDVAFHYEIDTTDHLVPCPENSFGISYMNMPKNRKTALEKAKLDYIRNLIIKEEAGEINDSNSNRN